MLPATLRSTRPTGRLALEIAGTGAKRMVGMLERMIPVRRPGRFDSVIETTYATIRAGDASIGWAEVTTVAPDPHATRVVTAD